MHLVQTVVPFVQSQVQVKGLQKHSQDQGSLGDLFH